jgi:small subunit ribosomal protein S12
MFSLHLKSYWFESNFEISQKKMNRMLKFIKRSKKKYNNLDNFPQESAVCLKVLTMSPKKPNSANRRVCKVKIVKTKQSLIAKIPGQSHNLQQHSTILIRCGRSRDLIGVKNIAIRGKFDLAAVSARSSSRSIYGVKFLKK